MMKRHRLIIAIFAALLPAIAWAAYPAPQGFVNDFAGVISAGAKSKMEGFLTSFERSTGNEVAVVTLPSLDEQPIEDVAVELYEQWGIGKKGQDNGVLFLIAPNERKTRIEVGYGLEGSINDSLAGRILDEAVLPRFREGDMSGGIASGALLIVETISKKEGLGFDAAKAFGAGAQELGPVTEAQESSPLSVFAKIILFLVMAYLFIRHPWLFLIFLSGMGRGGSSGGRGFSSGFGGFGGGLSGGGGASRGW